MASLSVYVNTGSVDDELNVSGASWTLIDPDNDRLIFTGGSDVVADGETSPGSLALNQAGLFLTGVEQIIDTYLLDDVGSNILREIDLMGNQNKRYVMAFDFDDATASEPVLEAWDDEDLDSITAISLGTGTPTNSFYRGITTTDGLPGTNWTGIRLAGSSDNHFIYLNNENGPLATADTLYCNLKIVIPATQLTGLAETPVLVCKFGSN